MVKYKCPKCGGTSKTSYCFDCGMDLPLSARITDESENVFPVISTRTVSEDGTVKYICPKCGGTSRTSYCFDCDEDIPMSSREGNSLKDEPNYSIFKSVRKNVPTSSVGNFLFVDDVNKTFRVNGGIYNFKQLVGFELVEDDTTVLKGGVGRAVAGGLLFGGVGAVVGAATRKSSNVVNSLYVRLSINGRGMEKINLISFPTKRNSFTYRSAREQADDIISQLEIIENNTKSTVPPSIEDDKEGAPKDETKFSVADELIKLKQLLDIGVLTQEEFDQEKKKLLDR